MPVSWPATANRRWPSASISATRSPARVPVSYPPGGLPDSPVPRWSGATTEKSRASAGITSRQAYQVWGQPCTSSSGGPSPPVTTCWRRSPVSTYRLVNVPVNPAGRCGAPETEPEPSGVGRRVGDELMRVPSQVVPPHGHASRGQQGGNLDVVLQLGASGHGSVSGLAGGEVLGMGGVGELLAHQAGQQQQRAAWPVVRHDVLGLPGGVAGDQDDRADGLAADLSGVVLEEAVVADGADEVELLVLIQRADGDQDCPDGLRALRDAVHRRPLYGDVVGQVVQPRQVVVGETASRIAASQICHGVPPPADWSWQQRAAPADPSRPWNHWASALVSALADLPEPSSAAR